MYPQNLGFEIIWKLNQILLTLTYKKGLPCFLQALENFFSPHCKTYYVYLEDDFITFQLLSHNIV